MTSVGIDCSEIRSLGIDKQENLRAGIVMIECGLAPAGSPASAGEQPGSGPSLIPFVLTNVQVSNRSCSSSSSCTKSESMVWASTANGGQTIVDNYNDHNPTYSSYSGTSYSTNGGASFTELQPPPFASGHGSNFGDPIVVFNAKLNKWFAGDLVTGCGSFGIGLWTSTNGINWTVGACAHNGTNDDRESMWADNEPSSGVYGRMYISFNDFSNNNGALSLVHSDDGVTWSSPVILDASFIRDVQLTGSPVGATRYEGSDSTVFVAAMDEGGGGLNTRQNVIYKSLDGGVTWTSTTTGPRFAPPGSIISICGTYFAAIAPIWRHMGWGQPGAGPSGVVHYAYAGAGTNGDTGDIYYVRSTDNGRTWSTPIKLNTDTDNSFHTQWMPSLTADKNGNVTASWYDRRAATSSCSVATDPGCSYERVGIQSTNNGAAFGPEATVSTGLIPQPTQTDSGVQACYAGDYNYDTILNGNSYDTWTDGRRAVGGVQVQDVEFAAVVPATTSLVLNYYDQATTGFSVDDVHVSNPNSTSTDADIDVDSVNGQILSIAAEGDSHTNFPGDTGGPVFITGNVALTASQRVFYNSSFGEVDAQSSSAASTQLWLNWYDQQNTAFKVVNIHLANPSSTSVTTTVSFGANSKTVTVPANSIAIVNFAGQVGGPVHINSSGAILASARTEYDQSFNEVNAVPVSQASTVLDFSWYDQVSPGYTLDNIHIGNPSSSSATVTVSLSGTARTTVTIAAGGEAVVNLGALSGGPVKISSNVPVIASQRVFYYSSFNEVYAVPTSLASTKLLLNWYDQADVGFNLDNVHLVNPSSTSSTVTVTVGASSKTVTIASGGATFVSFPGVVGGPVFITGTVPVLASARTQYNQSFNEVNAIPVP